MRYFIALSLALSLCLTAQMLTAILGGGSLPPFYTTGLKAQWDFIQGASASTVYDRSVNGQNGTITGSPSWNHTGLSITSTGQYATSAAIAGLNVGSAWTMVLCARQTNTTANGTLFSYGDLTSGNTYTRTYYSVSATLLANQYRNATNGYSSASQLTIPSGWVVLAMSFDGNVTLTTTRLDNSTSMTATPAAALDATTGSIAIGVLARSTLDFQANANDYGYLLMYSGVVSAPTLAVDHTAIVSIMASRGVFVP